MTQNSSVPERRHSVMSLPPRVEQGMSKRQRQMVFEQVKVQVQDIANRYFEMSLRVLRRWLSDGH